ncbi:uncharacterized protein LOC7479262 isoform X2 [Populus trichocarpa]|uniref:uncharacterized protein LOC7479262 isoform X2 n=1 Tax=Populus trichocarpa TaxID=3694 RepID=UPI0022792711|nr:uncharacterized protein LOC7479262 isoform X2 [Populus trichocarpa]
MVSVMKEKRWVVFKGEEDPTSLPVEWICWLNGQRKRAPTPEELIEMEARRELVKQNVALLKQEEEERRAREGSSCKSTSAGKTGGPDLKSFIRQFPTASEEREKLGERKQKNLCQSIQNQLDLVQPSSQGHGNHRHEMDYIVMLFLLCIFELVNEAHLKERVDAIAGMGTSKKYSLLSFFFFVFLKDFSELLRFDRTSAVLA